MAYDYVSHPSHYGGEDNPYEAIKVIEAWDLNFSLGSAVKYISRAGKKPNESTLRDLRKAKQYLEFEIDRIEKRLSGEDLTDEQRAAVTQAVFEQLNQQKLAYEVKTAIESK